MKYDKEYIKKLAASLHIALDDELLAVLEKDINELAAIDNLSADIALYPAIGEKKINCSKMKEDKPIKSEVDALSGCKKANKYVVGK